MVSRTKAVQFGLLLALVNFFITAVLGTLLRYDSAFPIADFAPRFWAHAHSHVGFLGWVFQALVILGYDMLLPKDAKVTRKIYLLTICFQVAVLGMLFTFPFMGYAAPSIIFSTLHLILSIVYAIVFFRHAKKDDLASKFMKVGLVFMVISNLGPLALGPIMAMGLKGSLWYDMAIYYYLHFQYNGWFTMVIFALFIKLMENYWVQINLSNGRLLLKLLLYGSIFTLALSALGFDFPVIVNIVGFAGAILQLWGGILLIRLLSKVDILSYLRNMVWVKAFFLVALISWLLKITMQFLSAIPIITDFAYLNRDAIIFYLHLSFLGFTSCFLFGLLLAKGFLMISGNISKIAFGSFLFCIVLTEVTIGIRSLPQLLNLQLFRALNNALVLESFLLCISVGLIVLFAFILAAKQKHKPKAQF